MNYTKLKIKEYIRVWRSKRRIYAITKLGGKCCMCYITENLDFDHINPKTKIKNIGSLWTSSKVKFEKELLKCQLLCKKCHIEKTKTDGSQKAPWNKGMRSSPDHGIISDYRRGCRCEVCKKTKGIRNKEYRIRLARLSC